MSFSGLRIGNNETYVGFGGRFVSLLELFCANPHKELHTPVLRDRKEAIVRMKYVTPILIWLPRPVRVRRCVSARFWLLAFFSRSYLCMWIIMELFSFRYVSTCLDVRFVTFDSCCCVYGLAADTGWARRGFFIAVCHSATCECCLFVYGDLVAVSQQMGNTKQTKANRHFHAICLPYTNILLLVYLW